MRRRSTAATASGRSTSTGCWRALTPDTRLLLVNSPNNPTGWTLTRDEQRAILEHCRRHGIWLVADDVYERLYYRDAASAAPSFLDLAEPEERVVSTNSFSKSWLMTGWRLGWIVAPRALMPDLGKLIEYNTSCSPAFVQHAGVAAITQGEPTVARTRERLRRARDFLVGELAQTARHRGRAAGRRDVRVLPRRRVDRQPRVLQAARARGAPRPRARAARSGPKAKASCAGASPRTRRGSPKAWRGLRARCAPMRSRVRPACSHCRRNARARARRAERRDGCAAASSPPGQPTAKALASLRGRGIHRGRVPRCRRSRADAVAGRSATSFARKAWTFDTVPIAGSSRPTPTSTHLRRP